MRPILVQRKEKPTDSFVAFICISTTGITEEGTFIIPKNLHVSSHQSLSFVILRNKSGLGHIFLFVGLRYIDKNFKVRRSEKMGLLARIYKFTTTSEVLRFLMTCPAIYSYT